MMVSRLRLKNEWRGGKYYAENKKAVKEIKLQHGDKIVNNLKITFLFHSYQFREPNIRKTPLSIFLPVMGYKSLAYKAFH